MASLACAPAFGQESYRFTIDPGQSSSAIEVGIELPMSGTWRGDYDATTNPGGTQTRLGLFGGSGNQLIPFTATGMASGSPSTPVAGSFELDLVLGDGLVYLRGMSADLLGGQVAEIDLDVELEYSTFRTISPSALFLGGVPITVPLGTASATEIRVDQTSTGVGTLTLIAGTTYEFSLVAPVVVTVSAEALGQPLAPEPFAALMPVAGTIDLPPGGPATLAIGFDGLVDEVIPAPPEGIVDLPLDLPTVLPPGQVAHLLVTADFGDIPVLVSVGFGASAEGEPFCRADLDGSGTLDFFDFIAFQDSFSLSDPRADLNGDGLYDFFDFILFQDFFAAGCP